MSYYEGLSFFVCLVIVLLVAIVIGALEKPLKWYSLLVSLLFVAFVFAGNPAGILYLVLFYIWSSLLILGYFKIRTKNGRKAGIYHAAVLLSLVPLVMCKVTPLFHLSIFGFVGISYLTFRVVQMIIEIYDGVIKEVSLVEITAFLAFFPSFSSSRSTGAEDFSQTGIGCCPERIIWSCAERESGSCCSVPFTKW